MVVQPKKNIFVVHFVFNECCKPLLCILMHGSGYALTFEVNALRVYITSKIQRTENTPIFEIVPTSKH
jgi:hypothetical protein